MTENSLETRLRDLKGHIDYPDADLAGTVAARIAKPQRRSWRLAVAMAALVILAALTAVPDAREAVARLFGVRGVEIQRNEEPPPSREGGLNLGRETGLAEAATLADFPIYVASLEGLPAPKIFVQQGPGGLMVHMLYPPGGPLPEGDGGAGMLITQFRGTLDRATFTKIAASGTEVSVVPIGHLEGIWLSGEPHHIFYRGPGGEPVADTLRLAGQTLLWEVGEVTLRLESEITLEAAVDIARQMRLYRP